MFTAEAVNCRISLSLYCCILKVDGRCIENNLIWGTKTLEYIQKLYNIFRKQSIGIGPVGYTFLDQRRYFLFRITVANVTEQRISHAGCKYLPSFINLQNVLLIRDQR